MTIGQRLRALDDRVLGPPRRPSATALRNGFLFGVAGALAVLLAIVLTGRPSMVAGIGGFVGVAIGNGVRWLRRDVADPRRRRVILSGGALVLVLAGAATFATRDAWRDDVRDDLPPGWQGSVPTMVVTCAETGEGPSHTYQAPVTETPWCENGADPQVVLRP